MSFDGVGNRVPFVMGQIRGLRSFLVTDDGTLCSVIQTEYVWSRGENIAQCKVFRKGAHNVGEADCSCGFYAYFGSSSPIGYANRRTVMGVVEAYGRVTFGDEGFRASKARIVGLYNPVAEPSDAERKPQITESVDDTESVVDTRPRWRRIKPIWGMLPFLLQVVVLITCSGWLLDFYDGRIQAIGNAVGWTGWLYTMFLSRVIYLKPPLPPGWSSDSRLRLSMAYMSGFSGDRNRSADEWMAEAVPRDALSLLREKYYDIPQYNDLTQLLTKHTITYYNDIKHLGKE